MVSSIVNDKIVLFRPIAETLTGTTFPGQSGPASNGNKGVHYIPQNSRTRASPSDGLESYPRWGVDLLSAVMQLAYSTAATDWANR